MSPYVAGLPKSARLRAMEWPNHVEEKKGTHEIPFQRQSIQRKRSDKQSAQTILSVLDVGATSLGGHA
jgi:hypothetical protein